MKRFVGKILRGSYVLEEFLGEGNFGAVFKGTQIFLGTPVRTVAIKLSKHTHLDVTTARTLFADAFVLAQAQQEMVDPEAKQHLLQIYDMGIIPEEENRGFLVMEYVRGTTLAEQFASFKRVPASLLIEWMLQMCSVLQRLLELLPPLLHRDLKPDNVLLGANNVVRLVDFGLAARLMSCGYIPGRVGAFAYMAPEVMMGESIPASDIFSIGVMLYQGLTGQHPFAHLLLSFDPFKPFSREQWYKQMHGYALSPPSRLNNTVPALLDTVVLRCLEFYPNRRYDKAGALLKDLTKVQDLLGAI